MSQVAGPSEMSQQNNVIGNALLSLPKHLQPFLSDSSLPPIDEWVMSRLNQEQSQIYKQLLFARLSVGDSNEHVVDFDSLWVELGYANKHMAKKNLVEKYRDQVDFVSVTPGSERVGQHGGQNAEKILLTLRAAKKFSIKAHTARGSLVADFFIDALDIFSDYLLLSRYKAHQVSVVKSLCDVSAARKRAEEAEAALKKANEENLKREQLLDKLRRRIKNKHAKGQTVYLLRNPSDRQRSLSRRDIGFTKDLSNRECQYKTSMPDGPETVHCRYTTNGRLVESLVHHIVDDHRYVENHEWFEGDPVCHCC